MEEIDAKTAVRDAIELAMRIEEELDGEDLMIILMALSKVTGVMLAEAKGLSPLLVNEEESLAWMKAAIHASYKIHTDIITPTDGHIH